MLQSLRSITDLPIGKQHNHGPCEPQLYQYTNTKLSHAFVGICHAIKILVTLL